MSHRTLSIDDLPRGESPAPPIQTPHFPTTFQAVLWRNWELLPLARLARVLKTDEATLLREAQAMGLRTPPQTNPDWETRGYLTILRRNWHLLPYEQILELLEWTPERLLHILHEEDFLWIKFGMFKPQCARVEYSELNDEQRAATEKIRESVRADFPDLEKTEAQPPFHFVEMLQTPAPVFAQKTTPARDGEITLDETWSIVLEGDSRVLRAGAKRFAETHQKRWNIALPVSEKSNDDVNHQIVLRVVQDEMRKPESHTIEVSPARVLIEGVDENGVLRGLQYLEETMKTRGGAHLSTGKIERDTRIELRVIHPYNAIYGDVLADENLDPLPEGLLSRLAACGVNGVWLQGLLYALFPWQEAPELSAGYEKRLQTLRTLCEKAGDYGIGVYFYMNEPRALPFEWFERYPQLKEFRGVTSETHATSTLCTSCLEIKNYLRDGAEFLFQNVPQLAGLFTITRSENMTNCWSHGLGEQCPRCRERPVAEVIAEVNALLLEGARKAKKNANLVAWTWGWSNSDDGSLAPTGWVSDAIAQMPQDVIVMCTSEEALPISVAGIESTVIDYTISKVGPGPHAKTQWQAARENGKRCAAKVQFNNTWENSAVPYIPVPDLVHQHLCNLDDAGVSALWLSWSLGGFPSPNLQMAAASYFDETRDGISLSTQETRTPAALEEKLFGAAAEQVRKAHEKFAEAFAQYPFHIGGLYGGPQNYGPMNLLHAAPTGHTATMIGFPYDDLKTWRSIYPPEAFEDQWKIVSETWLDGLFELAKAREQMNAAPAEYSDDMRAALSDLENVALASSLHFHSVYSQIRFVRARDAWLESGKNDSQSLQLLREVVEEEIEVAKQLESVMSRDARIGFEASNHYYYTRQDLREKVLSCRQLLEHFAA